MSAPETRLLVAEPAASRLREGEVSLFSTEATASPASFSQEELFALSPAYSDLYAETIERLSPLLEDEGVPPAASRTILRDSVPSVLHFALDRALRLDRFATAAGAGGYAVSAPPKGPPSFARPEALRAAAAASREFNEAALALLAPAAGFGTRPAAPPAGMPDPAVERGFVNYNFEGRSLWQKARGRAFRAAARLIPGRAPALALSYSTFLLQDAGFFGPGMLESVRGRASFPEWAPETGRRGRLGAALAGAAVELERFLGKAGAGDRRPALARACVELMTAIFPADALEGARAHLETAARLLEPFAPTSLFVTETGNVEATFVIAAARARGFEIVGVQDGGHYGYEDDIVTVVEGEFPHFDRYVTWGWTRVPETRGIRGMKAVPLPAPWLSERAAHWKRDVRPGPAWWEAPRSHDLLLMSNKIYEFPPSPSGGAVSRSDHAPAFAEELRSLISGAKGRGIRVLHKSFNVSTMRLLARTLDALRREGGDFYTHVERLDKGLHPGLVARARMILWDQPGTGFLECLTAGLPTMVLWTRLYNREAPWAAESFAEMERAGLVHRDPAAVLDEFARFKAAPTAWMRDERRARAALAFCGEYARTDPRWKTSWGRLIREACSRR